ncbi:family S24 peptidase (plasmid) [Opitutaceae bacterium TAV5]|nr:family S24 peptidase [Opitutaceae bacterium TAV5]
MVRGMRVISIHKADTGKSIPLPLMLSGVKAGFPSPAEDYTDRTLDLNEHLIPRPSATFLVRASGESMVAAGILDGAILVVDRSLEARDGSIVVALVDGCFTVKRLRTRGNSHTLEAANPAYPDIMPLDDESRIWGVVTYSINRMG